MTNFARFGLFNGKYRQTPNVTSKTVILDDEAACFESRDKDGVMLVYQQKQYENDYHRLEYFSSIASFVVYTCFSIFSGKKPEDIFANERFSIFKKHNAMYLNLTPIQMQPSLTVFDLNAFVNYRVDEINTSMFAPCASEHNRCQIHLYNLNKSIHCVYNN